MQVDRALLASGNLKPSEATELVRLSPRGQDTLFNAIRTGRCRNYNDLRASATALVQTAAQLHLMPDAPPPPTKADHDLATACEANVERIAALLRSGIHVNQLVAVRKTNPHRAGTLADLLVLSRHDPHPDGDRWDTICQAGNVLLFIVHTWPEDEGVPGRIISVRKATRRERKAYEDGEH